MVETNDTINTVFSAAEAGGERIMSLADIVCIGLVGLAYSALFYILLRYLIIPSIAFHKQGSGKGLLSKAEEHLSTIFCVVWTYGFIAYFIGSFVGSWQDNWLRSALSVIPMSIIHATEMFLGQSDVSAIHEDRHESVWFMMLFDTSHFAAVTVSLLFVLKHLGFYIASKYKLQLESKKHAEYDNIYLFWGVNDASLQLARSTITHENKRKERILVVFVKTPLEDDEGNQRIGFGRLLNFISLKDRELDKLNGLENSIVVSTFHKLSTLELNDSNDTKTDILADRLKLKTLARIISRLPDISEEDNEKDINNVLHIFFLCEDRDANINATINILRDSNTARKRVNIYCQARCSHKSAWMEHYHLLHPEENAHIHIIDTAQLSVMQLKRDVRHHPMQYVEWDTATGISTTEFTSMIIGFNETGVETLKFLYEFSTFTDTDAHRLPCHYTVMDAHMSTLAPGFYAKAPAMKTIPDVHLMECHVGDETYWDAIARKLPRLNYVVIAAGDDNLGINAAADICNMAYRNAERNARTRLTVFVRSYDMDNHHRLQKVADDVNRLYSDRNISIVLFGSTTDLFTYSLIIDDEMLRNAKIYNREYAISNGEINTDDTDDTDTIWRRTLGIKPNPDSYSITDIEEIERKRDQNFCNSLHKDTKNEILRRCQQIEKPSETFLTHMAQLEHERWVAYSIINGWQRMEAMTAQQSGKIKDLIHKRHADICPWDEIRSWDKASQTETHGYDYNVVITSIRLAQQANSNS